ncbi:hypothetical protein [Tenacibaculum mesophilum]|uniref:hypothetical protein n=1 Tax=Tenacibaculum mesophilum TaxID=104268 RepID=UPI0006493B44|nr:hypothetical protein [Tenacibaculum mesophilum]|eukprot:TRINITY_DN1106_c0_g2_i1.p1 TRINITY_DN1106_c0_g2~~TRINITY_DN1106_c0_g2_i1.p1  ORF type:complete len:155 (+),score=21.39 TRINITY_DN1106_c0_g2_i1:189-653(+)
MDLGTIIIGAILLVICIVPFILVRKKQLTKKKKKLQILNNISLEYNCNIEEYEFCNDFVLGIDKSKNYLFYFKQSEENIQKEVINLQTIEECIVIKKTRSINDRTIELIKLNFIKDNETTSIIIYDEKKDLLISNELLVANKWALLINSSLKKQ